MAIHIFFTSHITYITSDTSQFSIAKRRSHWLSCLITCSPRSDCYFFCNFSSPLLQPNGRSRKFASSNKRLSDRSPTQPQHLRRVTMGGTVRIFCTTCCREWKSSEAFDAHDCVVSRKGYPPERPSNLTHASEPSSNRTHHRDHRNACGNRKRLFIGSCVLHSNSKHSGAFRCESCQREFLSERGMGIHKKTCQRRL